MRRLVPRGTSVVVALTIACAAFALSACTAANGSAGTGKTSASAGSPTMPAYALEPNRSQLIAQATAKCLKDRGWNVTVSSDAGVSNVDPLPDDELQSYQDDYNDCFTQSGGDKTASPADLTDAVLARAWEREKQSWECLHVAGFTVAEVPSLTVYEQTARAGKLYSTWALLAADNISESDAQRLAALCPDPMQWFGQ